MKNILRIIILIYILSITAVASEQEVPIAVRDQSWVEVYRQILENERPYKITDTGKKIVEDYVINEFFSQDIGFSIIKSNKFDYPLLYMEGSDRYTIVIVSYNSDGQISAFGHLVPGQRSVECLLFQDKNTLDLYIYPDDRMAFKERELLLLSNVKGEPKINYGYSLTRKGFASMLFYEEDRGLYFSGDEQYLDGSSYLSNSGIVPDTQESFTSEEFENLFNQLELVMTYGISTENYNNEVNKILESYQKINIETSDNGNNENSEKSAPKREHLDEKLEDSRDESLEDKMKDIMDQDKINMDFIVLGLGGILLVLLLLITILVFRRRK